MTSVRKRPGAAGVLPATGCRPAGPGPAPRRRFPDPGFLPALLAVLAGPFHGNLDPAVDPGRTVHVAAPAQPITLLASRAVDRAGAELAVGSRDSPIDGLVVHIPAGALARPDTVSLGFSTRPVAVRAGRGSGVVIVLQTGSLASFQRPVAIEVPVPGLSPEALVVPYRVDDQGRLHLLQLTRLDPDHQRFWFDTFAPGQFTWVYP